MGADLRYPIGKVYQAKHEVTPEEKERWINDIAEFPLKLRLAVQGLSPEQLDTPYRPGGWTVRQVVHHLAEGQMVAYTRVKFALTEDHPIITIQQEDLWAELPDYRDVPIESSLQLFQLIQERLVTLLRGLNTEDFGRAYVHPVSGTWTLENVIGLLAWHSKHHTAHITSLRERMGW
ncbi:putative metal-dependent hydrolase [Alicyclobacillus fastidiosus]|uniref:Metal-dependent hydrolase n=1 Tax=Alicyclobacillus fastidiosus TaxID=392011 RepID=A0ABY6ZN07_9BACL|nr:putative metal-dependent hydrolase [Alicyclobacillus fastidiosus]WAH43484.1 putative metal-dependent hydrolase [Alicyclobacillus fastidiosus]